MSSLLSKDYYFIIPKKIPVSRKFFEKELATPFFLHCWGSG
jgi:hypothetical protein